MICFLKESKELISRIFLGRLFYKDEILSLNDRCAVVVLQKLVHVVWPYFWNFLHRSPILL